MDVIVRLIFYIISCSLIFFGWFYYQYAKVGSDIMNVGFIVGLGVSLLILNILGHMRSD